MRRALSSRRIQVRTDPHHSQKSVDLVACLPALLRRLTAALAGRRLRLANRVRSARSHLRRAWNSDLPWLGRVVAVCGNHVTVEGWRFSLRHVLITDTIRARVLRGRYERSERELLRIWLNPQAPVIELGGGLGIVATIVNHKLARPRDHLVVEANPSLIPVLEQHKRLNGAGFTVLNRAIDYSGQPLVSLCVDGDFISGRIGPDGADVFRVQATTLRSLAEEQRWERATLVCDIEGAEADLVEHDADTLARWFDLLVIEAHPEHRSSEQLSAMFGRLSQFGFERVASVRKVHVFRRSMADCIPE
jgi:FkbM family methyltransferase